MEKKDRIISLFRIGMDRKAIEKHEDVSRSYTNKVISDYKKQRGSIKYYYDRFSFNETYRLFIYSTIIAILIAVFFLYQNISTNKEIVELKQQNTNYSLRIIEITSAIEESLRLDDIEEIKRTLNETIKEKTLYKNILDRFSEDFYNRANLAYDLEDFRQAVYFYNLIEDSNSIILKNADYWFRYGLALMQTRHVGGGLDIYFDAINAFNRSKNLFETDHINPSVYFNLGKIYYELWSNTGERDYLKKSYQEYTYVINLSQYFVGNTGNFSLSPFLFGRGLTKQSLGDNLESLQDFNQIKPHQEYYLDSKSQIVHSLFNLNRTKEALEIIKKFGDKHVKEFTNPTNYYRLQLTYSYILKENGIKEENATKIIQSYQIIEPLTKDYETVKLLNENDGVYEVCYHKAHLVAIITGNQSVAELVFNQCFSLGLLSKANIYPISVYDPKEKVEFLLHETDINSDNEEPLNMIIEMFVMDENNYSIPLGVVSITEDEK